MKKFSINGFYNPGGQLRFMVEMLKEVDKIIEPNAMEIVLPRNLSFEYKFDNIEIVRFGPCNKIIWVQVFFPFYTLFKHTIGINFFNACPLIKPDIVTIHDLTQVVCKSILKTFRTKLSYCYNEANRIIATKRSKLIFTVSETSKNDIIKYYKVNENKIVVLGNSWQHINEIESNDDVLEKFPMLQEYNYYLAVGTIIPNKNIKWIKEVAKRDKKNTFAIVGANSITTDKSDLENDQNNLYFLGRLSDEDVKGLMSKCKALIHPAIYEGFGIPPMEALSLGRPIIIAKASCLPEIYGDSAHYFDPFDYDVNLDKLLLEPVANAEKVLSKYRWDIIASKFYRATEQIN